MGWRYRKSIKIIPGVRINLSGRGISTTIGVRGASVNISKKGTYLNLGISGTGLSYRERIDSPENTRHAEDSRSYLLPNNNIAGPYPDYSIPDSLGNILTIDIQEVTSQDMAGIKETIIMAYNQRSDLGSEVGRVNKDIKATKLKLLLSRIALLGLFNKPFIEGLKYDIQVQEETVRTFAKCINGSLMNLQIELEGDAKLLYDTLVDRYKTMMSSKSIWDVTGSYYNDRFTTRSAASTSVTRTITEITHDNLTEINCDSPAFHFHNKNGADIYIYPDFIIMFNSIREFAIIGFHELEIYFSSVRFVEEQSVPTDSQVLEYTWAKVNNDGKPDRRFKDNYQIPIVMYAELEFKTNTGVHEGFQFSNHEACQSFYECLNAYQYYLSTLKRI